VSILGRIQALGGYVKDVTSFLRDSMTREEARDIIEEQMANREEAFLQVVEAGIGSNPANPYYRLLEHAGIKISDVRRMVKESGLEGALEQLHDAGVYVTQDEFKGRKPIRREGLEFKARGSDFDNPLAGKGELLRQTGGGSTGEWTRESQSVDSIRYRAAETLIIDTMKAGDRPIGVWRDTSIKAILRYTKVDRIPEKLFTTTGLRRSWDGVRYAVILRLTLLGTRIVGRRVPAPEVVTRDSAITVARWLAAKTAAGTPAMLNCHASLAVRICLVAREHGLDITDTLFQIGGEPYTPTRAAVLASAGASAIVRYSTAETTLIGISCGAPGDGEDDVHLLSPKLALIQREHVTPAGETVAGVILTGLLPSNPKILLNLYTGDYANMRERDCDCDMGRMGFRTHLSGIRSYEKLTGGGVTFVGSKLYELVEVMLPSRFGGSIHDYQLAEEEAANGLAQASIIVSDRVGSIDEEALIETLLHELETTHARGGGQLMAMQWRKSRTLRVIRREPYETRNHKVLPFVTLGAASRQSEASKVPAGVS
jgi:hypothetical protein